MSCGGCSGAVKRVLTKMEGVESFDIDMEQQKVTVKGNVKPEDVFQTAYLLQKIVGHVMFGTSLRLLRLEKSQRVVNNSPCYRVSAAFFYGSNFDASVEPVELCREKRTALPSTRWWEAGSITRAGSTTPPNHGLSAGSRQNINSAKKKA
ncbi:hypothetical protein TRIUR3_28512 [Triticum urartu]|uniref:HMA domain-containing protein n=1 Tax=Triticum urartu TaxID=4572 RepID=M7Z0C2_TRIUA|nr:hypothetical protein TRIUR3_28512 [Triticum urartu]